MAFWGSFLRSGHFTDEMPSMPKKPRMPSSKVWTNCNQNVGFHFPMCLQQCSPADASHQCMAVPQHSCTQMGRRRWPPLGGVQWNNMLKGGPAIPPKVCQQRARLISNWLCPITAGQSRHSFEQFVRAIRSEVFFPLSFPFPRSLGTTANPTPKSGKVWFFRIFGRFFRLPNRA